MKSSAFLAVAFVVCACVFSSFVTAAEPFRSGLQPGEQITTVFEPLNLNGAHAEEPHCLVCENGLCPVAMVLARDVSEPLLSLLSRLDAACQKHAALELGSFAVFFDAPAPLETKLRAVAAKQKLKKLVLSLEAEANIPEYKAAAAAEVTVMLYVRHHVKATFAFRKGELNDAAIDEIVDALPKILDEKP
jgi:hypothetical protein